MKTKHIILTVFAVFLIALNSNAQRVVNPAKTIVAGDHYEGGQAAMYKFINENFKYPPTAKRNRIKGTNIVKFILRADGTAENYQVVKNVGGGCGAEAKRLAQLLKFNAPGYDVTLTVPFPFALK